MSSSDASRTPNGDKLKTAFRALKPKGATAEARGARLLAALQETALGLILDAEGGKDDLRAFAGAFGRPALEARLSAASPDALNALAQRLEPKRRRFPKESAELVALAMRKLGPSREPKESAAPLSVPSRDAIFSYTDETALRAVLEAYPADLLKRIRLEHGLIYGALPPPKSKADEIAHIVASVFRRQHTSVLDAMPFTPRGARTE